MKVVEGKLPQKDIKWRVLIPFTPEQISGRLWQLAILLAHANLGEIVAPVVIPENNRVHLAAARVTSKRIAEAIADTDLNHKPSIWQFIVTSAEYQKNLINFVKEYDIDILLDDVNDPLHHKLTKIPCGLIVLRGDSNSEEKPLAPIKHILIPTSGGPNTVYGLGLMLPLTPEVEVTALYIASARLGSNEEALGRLRMRQTMDFIDANERIKTKLITASSVSEGIIAHAGNECDLVVLGASQESSLDKVLFGNIPDVVVRDLKKPVAIVRQPKGRVNRFLGQISWRLQNVLPRLNLKERTDAYVRIRRSARPNVDFYILMALASIIAGLGLITNSSAVVIGAMLVAPLMSPMVGAGMSIVLGDTRFLRLSLGAVVRGVLLSIAVGMLVGLLFLGNPLTDELAARTQPSLLDLAIALFSGMAGAFALSRSNAAGALPGVVIAAALVPPLATVGITFTTGYYSESLGASLLFITNFVAISSATAFVFLVLGFRPAPAQKVRQEVRLRSASIAIILLVIVAVLLFGTSYFLNQQREIEVRIETIVGEKVAEITEGKVTALEIVEFVDGDLTLDVTISASKPVLFNHVQELQEQIGSQLVGEGIIDKIAMTMTVIKVTELDPLNPPIPTATPEVTASPPLTAVTTAVATTIP